MDAQIGGGGEQKKKGLHSCRVCERCLPTLRLVKDPKHNKRDGRIRGGIKTPNVPLEPPSPNIQRPESKTFGGGSETKFSGSGTCQLC